MKRMILACMPSMMVTAYADDTQLIVSAANVKTRTAELKNITDWTAINNLSLNINKCEEIIFIDKRKTPQLDIREITL